jgi:hypothetical protein
MKRIIREKKAQAMTEFVIVIPLFLMMFVAMYQFALIGIKRVELAMFEREVMRYLTYDGEDADKINDFKDEYAQKNGLDASRLRISQTKETSSQGVNTSAIKINFLNNITGKTFCVEYDQPLTAAAAKITGKDSITLRSKLFTATGGSYKFDIAAEAKKMVGKLLGGGSNASEGTDTMDAGADE